MCKFKLLLTEISIFCSFFISATRHCEFCDHVSLLVGLFGGSLLSRTVGI